MSLHLPLKVTASSCILKLGIDITFWYTSSMVYKPSCEIHLEQAVGNLDVGGTAVLWIMDGTLDRIQNRAYLARDLHNSGPYKLLRQLFCVQSKCFVVKCCSCHPLLGSSDWQTALFLAIGPVFRWERNLLCWTSYGNAHDKTETYLWSRFINKSCGLCCICKYSLYIR